MEGIKIVVFAFIVWGLQLNAVQCQKCELERVTSGHISVSDYFYADVRCWTIPVPSGHFIHLQFKNMFSYNSCEKDYVKIEIAGKSDVYTFCSNDYNKNPITAFGDITVYYVREIRGGTLTSFRLEYTIKTIECLNKNSFKCDNNSCVPEEKVCNGIEDCKNGADEVGCGTGVLSIKAVSEAKEKAVSWLKKKRTAAWGWRENTPRAVVALYLASAATFNGTVLEEELMAKQTELKAAVALLRPSLTNSELSMFVNALLVTCHSPRHFYGNNLVKRLKEQVDESRNFTHPLAYLALCNANESWPPKAASDLNGILDSNSEYPFVKDLQAISLTALSCEANRSRDIDSALSNATLALYKKTIQDFKKLQAQDGSFGNVHTTALITQQWSREGTVSRRPGSGRPRGTSEREDRRVRRMAVAHRTASEIRAKVGTTVTQRTVTNRAHWRTEWRSVVFSDESRICLHGSDGHVLVRRRPDERLQTTCLRPRHTGPTPGVMVFPMTAGALSWLCSPCTANLYISLVIQPVVLPYMNSIQGGVFQQDNARTHAPFLTQHALQSVDMLPWPGLLNQQIFLQSSTYGTSLDENSSVIHNQH
ncbi:hypothetical protein AVEN_24278-1 [Araneus ventricosus]|uniref:CUB domain-containing protein n=1 Tax=Araneus ventricosus TaxID=182803 RepID=A0A4Y2J8S0_ARAVE|nr:hypothetical protein AVEN_24278-1 [Araneus ventricosus]